MGRNVFMLWSFFSILINNFMLANLVILFSQEVFGAQIKNEMDLMDSKIPFGIPEEALKYFRSDNEFDTYVRNNHEFCEVNMACSFRVVSSSNFAAIIISRMLLANRLNLLSSTGELAVYSFKKPIRKEYYNMYFVKGFPIFPQINNILLRVTSKGFAKYFDDYTRLFYDIEYGKNIVIKEKIRSQALGFEYFELFFKIYAIGMLIASFIFCFEYAEFRITKKIDNCLYRNTS